MLVSLVGMSSRYLMVLNEVSLVHPGTIRENDRKMRLVLPTYLEHSWQPLKISDQPTPRRLKVMERILKSLFIVELFPHLCQSEMISFVNAGKCNDSIRFWRPESLNSSNYTQCQCNPQTTSCRKKTKCVFRFENHEILPYFNGSSKRIKAAVKVATTHYMCARRKETSLFWKPDWNHWILSVTEFIQKASLRNNIQNIKHNFVWHFFYLQKQFYFVRTWCWSYKS